MANAQELDTAWFGGRVVRPLRGLISHACAQVSADSSKLKMCAGAGRVALAEWRIRDGDGGRDGEMM